MANNPHIADDGKPYRFSKTNRPANPGRKPSKLKKYIKDNGLSALDVSLIMRVLANKSREELKAIMSNPKEAILVAGVAAALLHDMTKGNTFTLQWLADRGVGKTPDTAFVITEDLTQLKPEERDAEIERLYQDYRNSLSRSGNAGTGQPDGTSGGPEETKQEEPGTPESADHD